MSAIPRAAYGWIAAVGFIGVLVVVTFASPEAELDTPAAELEAAEIVCRSAVSERTDEARFPFAARAETTATGRLRLSGTVDTGSEAPLARYNYECAVSKDLVGAYRADSVEIWQSH